LTTLDDFLYFAESKGILASLQVTPYKLKIIATEEIFWEIIEALSIENITFRFLEQRETGIDIHVVFSKRKSIIEVTLRIISPLPTFLRKIKDNFPSSEIFIEELSIEKG
jgi:hypothetical protein